MPASEPRASDPKKLPGIFISYRRSDNPDAVGRIYDRLVSEFGKARVFKDVDSIPLGQDFRGHLSDIVAGCAAVLAIVGPKWTDIRNEAGNRRLEDPDDFVRIELEAALARSVPVVPVLVGHAPMPGTSQLPSTLSSLAFRQSIEVRPDPDFHNDATRLVSALWAIVDPHASRVAPRAGPSRSWVPWLGALAAAGTLAAIALAIPAFTHLRETPPPETRIAISLPVVEALGAFALSPDGRQIVYRAKGDVEGRLWLRSLAMTNAQPLTGTAGFTGAPAWSPDGRSIAFVAGGALKRLDLGGGQPQTLATADQSTSVIWGPGGDILFNPGDTSALVRVAASGGPVTQVTKIYADNSGQRVHSFLPDGRHFLFASIRGGKERGTYLGSLDGSPAVYLTGDLGPGAYLPSGWMLIQRVRDSTGQPSGELVAYRLNLRTAKVGEPITIATEVGAVSASASGLVALSTAQVAGRRQLTWVDRSGAELGTIGSGDGTLDYPRIAPDGRRLLVSRVTKDNRDIWLVDGERASRMTVDVSQDSWPVWSPGGERIAFGSDRSGRLSLYVKSVGAAGGEEPLRTNELGALPNSWSADGQYLMYTAVTRENDGDIRIKQMTGQHEPVDFLNTPFVEAWGQFSRDGRWVAYMSNESGQFEVFVRPFPSRGTAVQWMVSTAGGIYPMWSSDGREIYYINPAGEMMATPVTLNGSVLVPGKPIKLFDARMVGGGVADRTGRQYDLAGDGRFLINREPDADAIPTVTLIQDWNPDSR